MKLINFLILGGTSCEVFFTAFRRARFAARDNYIRAELLIVGNETSLL